MNTQAKLIVLLLGSTLLWAVPSDVLAQVAKSDSHLSGHSSPLNDRPLGEKEVEDFEVKADELKLRVDVLCGLIADGDLDNQCDAIGAISYKPAPAHDGSTVLSRPPPV